MSMSEVIPPFDPTGASCATCVYWVQTSDFEVPDRERGDCRVRRPEAPFSVPKTPADFWCGEYIKGKP